MTPRNQAPRREKTSDGKARSEEPVAIRRNPVTPGVSACVIEGARTHNLKDITCWVPFGRLTVITGVSGSGKSSLAFDTLYAEGQRRFVDCLSTYARQFMQRLDRPDVDRIGEIEPPVAVTQENLIRNARSTVSTITEIGDHLQLLFAHGGTPHCLRCGSAMRALATDDAVRRLLDLPNEGRFVLAAPISLPESAAAAAESLISQGYSRVYREGAIDDWSPPFERGPVLLVIDRFLPRALRRSRAADSVEAAWQLGRGELLVFRMGEAAPLERLVQGLSCPACGLRGELPKPQLFSPNSPLGACPRCQGFGRTITLDRDKAVPDRAKSLLEDAVVPFSTARGEEIRSLLLRRARKLGVPVDRPFRGLKPEQQEWVFQGDEVYPGVEGFFRMLERKRYKAHVRIFLARFRGFVTCPDCGGSRRKPEALSMRLGGRTIDDLERMPVTDLLGFLEALELPPERRPRVASVLRETLARLRCVVDAGVGYLTLGRTGRTLSGGETQRLRIASALGSSLTGTLYVLDEPTAGLHAVDTERILAILRRLCTLGNTVAVVEHDPVMVLGADHLIVLGPSGGDMGGELLYEGPVAPFLERNPEFFRAALPPEGVSARGARTSQTSPAPKPRVLTLRGIRQHNVDIPLLEIPLDRLTVVTGVSGSGKSTLLEDVLYRNALRRAGKPVEDVGGLESLEGLDQVGEVLLVSQHPLGRSSRSNLVTFVGLYGAIRSLLAATPRARALGLGPGVFSFNVPGGRCEICRGMGTVTLEMHFLADIEVRCEACKGRRFRDDVLEVTWKGKNVLQMLDLTVREALGFFSDLSGAGAALAPLSDVGLDYCRLGQSTATLSGGEAQRLKLASFLAEGSSASRPVRERSRGTNSSPGSSFSTSRLRGCIRRTFAASWPPCAV